MYYARWLLKLFELFDTMLCCGRKKESIESGTQRQQQQPLYQQQQQPQHQSLVDTGRKSLRSVPTSSDGKRVSRYAYSRSYPESEAVAFGGRPHLRDKTLERTGRTADGHRERKWLKTTSATTTAPTTTTTTTTTATPVSTIQKQQHVPHHLHHHHPHPSESYHIHRPTQQQKQLTQQQQQQQQQYKQQPQSLDMGIKSIETFVDYTTVETVEINKRPGQTLGFYIREGNGIDRTDGVFISRIAAGSAVERNGLLRVGEEILAIDGLSLKGVCLDDVVILMSIPSKLLLTVRTTSSCCKNISCPSLPLTPTASAATAVAPSSQQSQVFVNRKLQRQQASVFDQSHIIQQQQLQQQQKQQLQQHYLKLQQPSLLAKDKYSKTPYSPYDQKIPKSYYQTSYQQQQPQFDFDNYLFQQQQQQQLQQQQQQLQQKFDSVFGYRDFQPPRQQYQYWRDDKSAKKSERRHQAESLDRKVNGNGNGKKMRTLDYFSDSETQLGNQYLKPLLADSVARPGSRLVGGVYRTASDETDDLSGVRELSRTLSKRRKEARLQMMERWKVEQEQIELERKIEEQERQLYLLQKQLERELHRGDEQNIDATSKLGRYKPILRQCYSDDYNRPTPGKYRYFYPPLQKEDFDLESKMREFELARERKAKSHDRHLATDKQIFPQPTTHRRRYSSDSEILHTGNEIVVTSSPSITAAANGIPLLMLTNGNKSNSLPADIENGGSVSNGDDPTQLKHWLRKLDRLSYDLKDFNGRSKNGINNSQKRKDSNGAKLHPDIRISQATDDFSDLTQQQQQKQQIKPQYKPPPTASKPYDQQKSKKSKHLETDKDIETQQMSFTSEEYKSWLSDRRMQSKIQRDQMSSSRLVSHHRPISSRDRAKIALSESRQKLAHAHFGHASLKLEQQRLRKQQQQQQQLRQQQLLQATPHQQIAQSTESLKKRFLTSSACQTTPSIDPEKRKAFSLDQDPTEAFDKTQPISKHIPTTKNASTSSDYRYRDYDDPKQTYDEYDDVDNNNDRHHHQHHSFHRRQQSLPDRNELESSRTDMQDEQIDPEHVEVAHHKKHSQNRYDGKGETATADIVDGKFSKQLKSERSSRKQKNGFGSQGEKLKEEPLKIRVEDFHPHLTFTAEEIVKKSGHKPHFDDDDDDEMQRSTDDQLASASTAQEISHTTSSSRRKNGKNERLNGSMYVRIFCGHGLKSSRRTILRDLYCVISVDGVNKARTAAKTGALNFDWDEDFELDLKSAKVIGFSIYSWDPVARQKLCFSAQLIIFDFLTTHGNQRRLAMKLQPIGTLYVEVRYRDLVERFSRVASLSETATFRVPLDVLIARESALKSSISSKADYKSGMYQIGGSSKVPWIVRACVRQVELRGIDCVSIYRLCGSYEKLMRLKKEVDACVLLEFSEDLISVDNIPDINVITGLLKQFFLDLPEPLFTGELQDMFIDAINVQIDSDPDGNANLMLSILDCLPKNNLVVLSFLMDHLKRIVQHEQFNKMDSLAIGDIFGPLLLCPSLAEVPDVAAPSSRQQIKKSFRSREAVDLTKQSRVITYLLDIWPAD